MPLPKGYTLDQPQPKLPAGFTLDSPQLPDAGDLSNVPGALPGMQTPQQAAGIQTPTLHGTSIDYGKVLAAGDVATGAAKGALHTVSSADQYARQHLPAPLTNQWFGFGKPADLQNVQQMATPTNTAQRIGYGGEQAGEFLIPGGAEEAAAAKLAEFAPALGRFAAPAARVATGALSTGLVNKAQGGGFGTGALMGAGGGALSEGLRVAAPIVAESALGVRAADRGRGRDAGRMILDETKGFNAGSIAEQAKAKVSGWNTALEQGAANSPMPVDLTPARQISGNAQTAANLRNNPETIKRIGQLSDLLNIEQGVTPNPMRAGAPIKSAAAIPPQVTASRALDLRRGTGELKGSWNPATPNDFADATIGRVYGSLNEGLYNAVPGASALDRNMSSMIPVAARAGATDLNASALQRILGRFTRPTGALVGSTVGMGAGYKEGGVPGALAGGAIGLVAPEIIGSPTAQMMLARGINKGATPVVRTLLGGGLQADRNSLYKPK